jgi:hypothetical protein
LSALLSQLSLRPEGLELGLIREAVGGVVRRLAEVVTWVGVSLLTRGCAVTSQLYSGLGIFAALLSCDALVAVVVGYSLLMMASKLIVELSCRDTGYFCTKDNIGLFLTS